MDINRRQLLRGAVAAGAVGVAGSVAGAPRARAATRGTADFCALAAGLDGTLVLPEDRDYDQARQLFSPRYDTVRPAAVAYPAHARDVATCLGFARGTGTPIVPRGGGHSYAGWSTGTGLVLDLGRMAQVSPSSGGAAVGAGARLGDVNGVLTAQGSAFPTGLCPSVGIAGLTLGGGIGVTGRAYGTTSDNLAGATVVTPDGRIREVDATHEPELFWALRGGGGGNFGVVTEFRFRTHGIQDCAHAELHWPWADAAALVDAWQRWAPGLPEQLWSLLEFDVQSGPPSPYVGIVSLDGSALLEQHLDELVRLVGSAPSDNFLAVRSYGDTMRKLAGCLDLTAAQCRLPGTLPGRDPQGQLSRDTYTSRSDFWNSELPAAGIDAVLAAVARYADATPPGGQGVVQFDGMGGAAINRPRPDDTAFVHRGARFLAQYLAYWPADAPAEDVRRHRGWLDDLWSSLRPWAGGEAYQNYIDPALPNWRQAYYGDNLDRLQRARQQYDPDRLLGFPQGL